MMKAKAGTIETATIAELEKAPARKRRGEAKGLPIERKRVLRELARLDAKLRALGQSPRPVTEAATDAPTRATWLLIAAFVVAVACGCGGTPKQDTAQAVAVAPRAEIAAERVDGVALTTTTDARQTAEQTTGQGLRADTVSGNQTAEQTTGQGLRADTVSGNQMAYQYDYDLSRTQLLLLVAGIAVLAAGIISGCAWCLFLGWFAPTPRDTVVVLLARVYLIAYPAAVVVGSGAVLWMIVRMIA